MPEFEDNMKERVAKNVRHEQECGQRRQREQEVVQELKPERQQEAFAASSQARRGRKQYAITRYRARVAAAMC
jgi:hypothetical protein